jgi:hypothetical protein
MEHHHHAAPPAAPTSDHTGHDRHAGHSVGMFRDRFWLTFGLTIPTLIWGHMLPRALGYHPPALPGAGVLSPWGIMLTPAMGAVLMSLSTVLVALNAQLLRRSILNRCRGHRRAVGPAGGR